jgi:hypothetical protein
MECNLQSSSVRWEHRVYLIEIVSFAISLKGAWLYGILAMALAQASFSCAACQNRISCQIDANNAYPNTIIKNGIGVSYD